MGRLEGKVVLITGAAGGMGRVAAEMFAAEGARIAAVDLAGCEETAVAVAAAGGEALSLTADVTDAPTVDAAVAATVQAFGALHVLYNNAGVSLPDDGGPTTTPEATWETTMAVNVTGLWRCCRAGIPALLDSGGGSIINVASFVAHLGAATPQLAYTTSKGAVLAMTREIAVIYARRGIRANALCPGPVLTPLLAKYLSDDEERQRRLVHIPMGRFGEAAEMVQGALFLASDESSYMTGQSLLIDGGITAAYTTPDRSADAPVATPFDTTPSERFA
ncbi:SDR family oxidoreductase [Iamia sp.]|uniref:SDR family oxidoreductase n=1 Tax=Iamia sp. TaxID=2722710 RepID=UPI002BA8525F|nr:SDR family oxidoreductase [Iamia sp.]HXH59697.1 SDR family oxidoreductase [Iamia sp.]